MHNFITDGYSAPFYIRAVEGLHGSLKGTRRPMLPDERDTMYQKALEKKTRPEQNAVYRRVIASKIESWDATDAQGAKIGDGKPAIEAALRMMNPPLWDKLFAIITGERPSDIADEPAASDATDDLDEAMAAAARGTAQAIGGEADAKN